MALLRLYTPVTAADVAALASAGQLPGEGRTAYGVSPALIAALPRADEEEREYHAFLEAVEASAETSERIAVASLDLPEVEVDWPAAGNAVDLPRPVRGREIVAFHIGEEPGADADLLWFDVTEAALVAERLA